MRTSIKDLNELSRLRDAIKVRTQQELAEKQRRQAEQQAMQKEATLFHAAIGGVTPIKAPDIHLPARAAAGSSLSASGKNARSEAAEITSMNQVMEQWSDEFDASQLQDDDDGLSYTSPGTGTDVLAKLRRGQWTAQAYLDLHGLQRDQARTSLSDFLNRARQARFRCVCIIHGKGMSSKNQPILPGKVRSWLCQSGAVQAFCQASAADGGAGAVMVLLTTN
jgi:DNA-nicking Smr family endonuclease